MDKRPKRPLGITLILLMSAVLFGIAPIAGTVFLDLFVRSFTSCPPEALDCGTNIDLGRAAPQVIFSGIFIAVVLLTWSGYFPKMRWLLIAMMTVFTVLLDISALRSGEVLMAAIFTFAALYITWYLNRAPARAFFRGEGQQDDE